jgi:hypothetical protein
MSVVPDLMVRQRKQLAKLKFSASGAFPDGQRLWQTGRGPF